MKAACIQLTTGRDPSAMLPIIDTRVRAAAAAGATFVALPETCLFMERGRKAMQARLVSEADSADLQALQDLAAALKIDLLIGSMVLAAEGRQNDGKAVNRSLLIGPDGAVKARYDKIHMFDVTLESGETHAESASYAAGSALAVAPLGEAVLGLSICYDVRFATLYRCLAQAGADMICVPSAFTVPTGAAHWHVLLRARAIETGAYILAPAQVGAHENGRQTYGHSLIVDPWGEIVAEADVADEFIMAELDFQRVAAARAQIPALMHGRRFALPDGGEADD